MAFIIALGFATISDYTNRRGPTVMASHLCYLTTLVVTRQVQPHVGNWSKFVLWTFLNAFAVSYHPSHNTWLQLNCPDQEERSIGIACVTPLPRSLFE